MSIFNRLLCITALAALVAASGGHVSAQTNSSLTNLLGQLKSTGASAGDSTLKSLGGELSSKAQMLSTSLAGNTNAQSLINGALQSMLGKKGGDSLAAWEKLSQAKLTPEQTKLAKDMSNLGSAYLVQKNLASLEGSKTEVAQIVSSLRKGSITEALPAIQQVSLNAKLTPAQKDLVTSLADRYAPGASKVGGALKGLQGVPGFGK